MTSVADERERCPGCGLRPEQFTTVEADLDRCPGCQAKATKLDQVSDKDKGIVVGFWPVTDSRQSVWAMFTRPGREWLAKHRRDDHPTFLPQPPVDGE